MPLFCALALSSMSLACDEKSDAAAEAKKAPQQAIPAKPVNDAPVAAEFDGFTGEGERGMKIHLYNFGDKPAVGYMVLARYYDGAGTLLKVKPGTPFEKDTDFTSLSGNRYRCDSKGHANLELDGRALSVPAEAAKAEILVTKVSTVGSDGMTVEDWWSQESFTEWPTDDAKPQ